MQGVGLWISLPEGKEDPLLEKELVPSKSAAGLRGCIGGTRRV